MNDDFEDFKHAMKGVKPLNQDTHKPHRSTPSKQPTRRQFQQAPSPTTKDHFYNLDMINQDAWVSGETKVSFYRSGVPKKAFDDLRRGRKSIQEKLDLHHMTANEAMTLVDQFLLHCLAHHRRFVLIIHGKGTMSRHNKPILKNILIEHLRQNSNVLAYQSAYPKDGGTGALYVLIKASHKV